MTFQQLKDELKTVKNGKEFQFDLSWIDSALNDQLDDFVKIKNNKLELNNTRLEKIDTNTISLFGEYRVKWSLIKTYFEIRIVLMNNSSLDYLITIEPNGNWEDDVDRSVKNILTSLPVSFKETMFIHSSLDLKNASISFDENKTYALGISKGVGIVTHITSPLLEKLNLPNALFHITRSSNGEYEVFKDLKFTTDIAGVFKISVDQLKFIGAESLSVNGKVALPFVDKNQAIPVEFILSKDLYQAKVKIDKDFKMPLFLSGDGVNVGNVEFDIQGAFPTAGVPPSYNYGLFANFAIGKKVAPSNGSINRNSLNDGELRIVYNSNTQATLVPVLIEAYAKEITLGKVVHLFAGKAVKIPDFLNRILTFYSTYFYYCESSYNRILLDGVEAKKGTAMSSGVSILGLEGYGDFSSLDGQTRGYVLVEPINLANLVTIEGDSLGTPSTYLGKKVNKGGVQLFFDSKGPVYFKTDVSVNLFDIYKFKTGGRVEEDGLQFYYDLDFGFGKVQIDCLLESIQNFRFSSTFDAKLLKLSADLGPLGKLSLDLSIKCEMLFAIKSQASDGKASLAIAFNFNGSTQKIKLAFNIKDIRNLDEAIRRAVIAEIKNIVGKAEEWLKAILKGVIKIADNAVAEAKKIADNLVREFGHSVEASAKLLQNAGYAADRTTQILLDGFKEAKNKIAPLLNDAGYSISHISKGLLDVLEYSPVEVLKALRKIEPKQMEQIGKALKPFVNTIEGALGDMKLEKEEAAALLKGLGKSVTDQAKVLKELFKATEGVAEKILKDVGNAPKEVTKAVSSVFGGGGSGGVRLEAGGASLCIYC